jgi:hypothetical protein
MATCKIARFRDATGGGEPASRIVLRADVFQEVTTSAWAARWGTSRAVRPIGRNV